MSMSPTALINVRCLRTTTLTTCCPDRSEALSEAILAETLYDLTYAEYTDGCREVCMSIAVCRSPEDARSYVDTASLESANVTEFVEISSVGTEPSLLKSRINNPRMGSTGEFTHFSWNRGRYYFSADAKTGDLLDSFMNQFP